MSDKALTKDKIKEKLESKAGNLRFDQLEVVLNYYLDENKDNNSKELEKKVYEEIIEENAENFFEEIEEHNIKLEKENITTLVSMVSLSPLDINKISETPVLKTIRAMEQIEKVILLYTEDSEFNYKKLKDHLKELDVSGRKIDVDNIDEVYKCLKEYIASGEISSEDTIMDSTLGSKMYGIALYKIAVERGINLIAWNDYQLPKYVKQSNGKYKLEGEGKVKRIPFLTKLTLMEEPILENEKTYRALEKELDNFNFSVAATYYNILGMRDLKEVCENLDNVFSLKNILDLDCEKFYSSLENMLKKLMRYYIEEEKNRNIVRELLIKFLAISDYKKMLKNINYFDIKETDVDYIEELKTKDKDLKTKIYYSFVVKYLDTKLGEELLENDIINEIIESLDENEKPTNAEEIINLLFKNYTEESKIILKGIFNVADALIPGYGEKWVKLDRNILKLTKYGLKIDLLKAEKEEQKSYIFTPNSSVDGKIKINAIAAPIAKLFENEDSSLNEFDISEIYNSKKENQSAVNNDMNEEEKKKEDKRKRTLAKNKSELKKIINFLNRVIKLELENLGKEQEDFIKIEYRNEGDALNKDGKNKSIKRIYINEFFIGLK